jgi:hypothetical protein
LPYKVKIDPGQMAMIASWILAGEQILDLGSKSQYQSDGAGESS